MFEIPLEVAFIHHILVQFPFYNLDVLLVTKQNHALLILLIHIFRFYN